MLDSRPIQRQRQVSGPMGYNGEQGIRLNAKKLRYSVRDTQ